MRNHKLQLALAGTFVAATGLACAVFSHPADTTDYFGISVAKQAASDSAVHLFEPKSLTDALPTVVYKYKNRDIRVSSLVATGKFSDPRKLDTLTNSEEPASTGTPPWQRGALTFTVKRVLATANSAQAPKVGERIQVEFYFDPQVDVLRAEQELANYDSAVAFLTGDGSASSPWGVAQNGSLVGQIDSEGRVSLPAAQKHADGRQFVDDILVNVSDVAGLSTAAANPVTVPVQ